MHDVGVSDFGVGHAWPIVIVSKTGLSDGWFARQIDSLVRRNLGAVEFLRPSALCWGARSLRLHPHPHPHVALLVCVDEEGCLGIDRLRHIFQISVLYAFLGGPIMYNDCRGREESNSEFFSSHRSTNDRTSRRLQPAGLARGCK
jgi:hypothetical protein